MAVAEVLQEEVAIQREVEADQLVVEGGLQVEVVGLLEVLEDLVVEEVSLLAVVEDLMVEGVALLVELGDQAVEVAVRQEGEEAPLVRVAIFRIASDYLNCSSDQKLKVKGVA